MNRYQNQPREETGPVQQLLQFIHVCYAQPTNLAVCKVLGNAVPKFNSFVYDSKERQVGKIEEVFGPIFAPLVAFKPVGDFKVTGINKEEQFGLRQGQMLPIERFRPQPERPKLAPKQGAKGGRPQAQRGGFQGRREFGGQGQQRGRFQGPPGSQGQDRPQGRFQGSQGYDRPQGRFQGAEGQDRPQGRFQNGRFSR